jgi:hypothetical protein
MGGSEWSYTVDFQDDVAATLEALREKVFQDGDYYPRSINSDYAERMGITPLLANPPSIDDLLTMQEYEGTHSILDLYDGVSAEPEAGTASPLTDDQLRERFGTRTPTCRQVHEWIETEEYVAIRDRGEAVYMICYLDDAPHQVFFGGVTGD